MIRYSLVLYGDIETNRYSLLNVITFFQDYCNDFGFPVTHFGIIGQTFTTGNILNRRRTEKRLKASIEKNEKIESVSLFSLPSDFTQAAFDYDMYVHIELETKKPFILLTYPQDHSIIDSEKVIKNVNDFMKVETGEVFKLSVYESPHLYASKVNNNSDYESLSIIKKFIL